MGIWQSFKRAIFHDEIRAAYNLTIEVTDAKTGEIIQTERVHNLVTSAGKDLIRDRLNASVVGPLTHFGIGTNSTAPAVAQTALLAQTQRDVITQTITDVGKLTVKYYLATGVANGNTLRECGIFTASSGGVMYARAVHNAIAKTASIAVTYTWELTWT